MDRRFDAWVRQRFARPLAALRLAEGAEPRERGARGAPRGGLPAVAPPGDGEPAAGDLVGQLARGQRLADAGDGAAALPYLQRASVLFPDLSGEESPRWAMARILEQRGDRRAAAAQLDTLAMHGEVPYEALLALARLREAEGDRAGAAEALDRAMWASPYDLALHQRLATLHEETNAPAKAVREWKAVVALGPVDRAEALYRLALAHERAGEKAEARRAVLKALDEAPNYERAQELLLRLSGGGR
jgi:tetratricopeptide (TPR) repeat protein